MRYSYVFNCICKDPLCKIIIEKDDIQKEYVIISPIFYSHNNEYIYANAKTLFNPLTYLKRMYNFFVNKNKDYSIDVLLLKEDANKLKKLTNDFFPLEIEKLDDNTDDNTDDNDVYFIRNLIELKNEKFNFFEFIKYVYYGCLKRYVCIYFDENFEYIDVINFKYVKCNKFLKKE